MLDYYNLTKVETIETQAIGRYHLKFSYSIDELGK